MLAVFKKPMLLVKSKCFSSCCMYENSENIENHKERSLDQVCDDIHSSIKSINLTLDETQKDIKEIQQYIQIIKETFKE